MLHLLKQLSFSKTFSISVSIPSCFLKTIYLLRHQLIFKFFSQSCDVIFPPKTLNCQNRKTKNIRLLFGVESSTILQTSGLKRIRTVKSSSQSAVSDVKLTRRDKFQCAYEKKEIQIKKLLIKERIGIILDLIRKEPRHLFDDS